MNAGVFLFCWIPFFSCHTSSAVAQVFYNERAFIPPWLFYMVTWLGYLNSLMNPIIYTTFNPEYRRAFRYLIKSINQINQSDQSINRSPAARS